MPLRIGKFFDSAFEVPASWGAEADASASRSARGSPRPRSGRGVLLCPHPLCPPLPRGGRGGGIALTPLPPLPLRGRGVSLALTPSPSPTAWERGVVSPHPQPLSHCVGEGSRASPLARLRERGARGVRDKKARLPVHARAGKIAPASKTSCRTVVPLPAALSLKGVGFLRACLLAVLLGRAFLPPCERDARAPSTRDAGNAGVPPAVPTAREKNLPP